MAPAGSNVRPAGATYGAPTGSVRQPILDGLESLGVDAVMSARFTIAGQKT